MKRALTFAAIVGITVTVRLINYSAPILFGLRQHLASLDPRPETEPEVIA